MGHDEMEGLLFKLKGLGPRIVVITDGKNHLFVMDNDYVYSAFPPPVKIVDATGAGDAFAASFLSGVIRKKGVEFAIKLGIINAQSVVKYYGAKNILLNYRETLRIMKNFKVKISKRKI